MGDLLYRAEVDIEPSAVVAEHAAGDDSCPTSR